MKSWLVLACMVFALNIQAKEAVVLLHGLAESSFSMTALEAAFKEEGYDVYNMDYPSRRASIAEQAAKIRQRVVKATRDDDKVNFVTHSLGCIILRRIQLDDPLPNLGRVVMLAPPNQGSELADQLGDHFWFKPLLGPASEELSTDAESGPASLGPAGFEVGIIAGNQTNFPLLSWLIPGEDDGIVSVETTRLEGMDDFVVVEGSHMLITRHPEAIGQAVAFIKTGYFVPSEELPDREPARRIIANRSRNPLARQHVGPRLDWTF